MINLRLPPELLAQVDAYAARLDVERPGMTHTRNDAIKVILAMHFAAMGAPSPSARPAPKPASSAESTAGARKQTKR